MGNTLDVSGINKQVDCMDERLSVSFPEVVLPH